jgi:hydrogenase maturation protease
MEPEGRSAMTAPVLVFGWGNPSRGDDALGPLAVDRLRVRAQGANEIDFLDDYQLMVEHALDLAGRERVLLVDASAGAGAPFEISAPRAAADSALTTHALSPQALLRVYRDVHRAEPPPCTLLAIRGERFGLGEPLSPAAEAHLESALRWAEAWLRHEPSCGATYS